jgi:folate-dependent phosphoribosylglycinamide formyltransferase PurN
MTVKYDQDIGLVNLAYITSCRWVDSDQGGTLENLARRIIAGEDAFARRFNLVCIVVDDDAEQYAKAWEKGDIWPRDLVVPIREDERVLEERTLESMTIQVPSQRWKDLRQSPSETLQEFHARKNKSKADYEERILQFLLSNKVDLILTDSYLTLFGSVLLSHYAKRIINIHPAITQVGDPCRIPGRTPTRDTYTRAAFGCIIVDDKRVVGIPEGRRIYVESDGMLREAVEIGKTRETGVTMHVITEEVDAGPVICCERYLINDNELSFDAIRRKNNRIKKELVPRALLTYIEKEEVIQEIRNWRP